MKSCFCCDFFEAFQFHISRPLTPWISKCSTHGALPARRRYKHNKHCACAGRCTAAGVTMVHTNRYYCTYARRVALGSLLSGRLFSRFSRFVNFVRRYRGVMSQLLNVSSPRKSLTVSIHICIFPKQMRKIWAKI